MNVLDFLITTPLPTAVATIVAIAAAAGYYFFVIPMMVENKELKEDVKKLNGELASARETKRRENDVAIDNILKSQTDISNALARLSTEMNPIKGIADVLKMLEDMEDTLDKRDPNHLTLFTEIKAMLHSLSEHVNNTRNNDTNIQNLLNEVIRFLHTISDKQSQIIGALLGMTRIQDRNRSL